jgi:hypothetical protein
MGMIFSLIVGDASGCIKVGPRFEVVLLKL